MNGPRAAVGDEADRVGGADRLAAHRPRDLGGRLQRLRGGLVSGDDLHQPHQRRRVEEVHAAHPLRPLDAGGDRGHRQRGGVGGQDRLRPAELGQLGEQAALQLEVLGRRLDHELAVAELLDALHEVQPFLRRLSLGFASTSRAAPFARPSAHPGLTCGERLAGPDRGARSRARPGRRAGRSRRPSSRRRRLRPARFVKLAPLELRLALLEERVHALDAVLGRHRQLVQAALVLEARRSAPSPRRRAPPAWRAGPRSAGAWRSAGPAPSRASSHSPCRRHLVDEAQPLGLGGVDPPPGQHQLHRPLLADHARQPLRSAAAGDDPERDLRLAELGRLGGDDHVAQQRQLAAAAEREARDRGDQRRPASRRAAARTTAAGWRSDSSKVRSAHRPDVGAGGEHLVATRRSRCSGPPGRRRSASTAVASSSISSGESALRASGRFRRHRATWPSTLVSTSALTDLRARHAAASSR